MEKEEGSLDWEEVIGFI